MSTSVEGTGGEAKRDGAGHWTKMARQWRHVGPPLRPAAQDIGFYWDAIRGWIQHGGAPRALLLGVTAELYGIAWPKGTDLLAVDRSQAMIDTAWPGPKEAVQCRDWLGLALPSSSRDIALCDGGLHLLAYPLEQRRLAQVLRDVLSDEGLCVLRLFVPPDERESPEAVLKDLLEGNIPNLNILKLRLWTSLLESAAEGVRLATVWQTVHEAARGELEGLASRIGWPVEQALAINAYRGSEDRYHFVTVEEASDLFCGGSGGFELARLYEPTYEAGGQCPTLVLRRLRRTRG